MDINSGANIQYIDISLIFTVMKSGLQLKLMGKYIVHDKNMTNTGMNFLIILK